MGTIKHRVDVRTVKGKALWLPSLTKYIIQILISIRALLTLPFFKETPNGVQKFFTNNYTGKKDEFIFDGTNENSYYDQIIKNVTCEYFENQMIVDFGCGNGSFYFWLKNKNVQIKQYYGVDFAFENKILSDEAIIKNAPIDSCIETSIETNAVYLLSNSLCYISDKTFLSILSNLRNNDRIIIIDPYPNLFWDSHFNGIKPFYRNNKYVYKLLKNNGFSITSCSVDYALKIGNSYFSPISYCFCAFKNSL